MGRDTSIRVRLIYFKVGVICFSVLLKRSFNDESLRCTMYIEEAKKERFVSFTRVFPNSFQGSDWMPQLSA
jgi:hypothetical protein